MHSCGLGESDCVMQTKSSRVHMYVFATSPQTIFIYGRGFGPDSNNLDDISIGGVSCTSIAYQSSASVTCVTPSGVGANRTVIVTAVDQSSAALGAPKYSYRPPAVSSISPNHLFTADTTPFLFSAAIYGSDLGTRTQSIDYLKVGDAACDVGFTSSSTIYCMNVDIGAAMGVVGGVQVALPGFGNLSSLDVSVSVGGQSFVFQAGLTVLGPPTVTSVTPSVVFPGTQLTIRGGYFGYSSDDIVSVTVGGEVCSPVYVLDPSTISTYAPNTNGLNLPVTVTTAGYNSNEKSSAASVSYSVGQAQISSVFPSNGPTLGAL